MRIGIDIGGTHTDGVVINSANKIVKEAKVVTTRPLENGFRIILQKLSPPNVTRICVGTTHATNALLEQKNLAKVGVLRLQAHGCLIPPCFGWPFSLLAGHQTLSGGYNCDGTPLGPISAREVVAAASKLMEQGAEVLAVVGVFSPLFPEQEKEVAQVLQEHFPDIPVTMSHSMGSLGILERENSAILNAALVPEMKRGFERLQICLQELGITAPLYITDNRGSLMTLHEALAYPIRTLAAGPTNSFIGAARLAGLDAAVVADVGGTSTDVGVVRAGYPRRSFMKSVIGGISLSFPMPDTLSVALGGGSVIKRNGIDVHIGPRSLGHRLFSEGISFGGTTPTLCDAAIALGLTHIDGAKKTLDVTLAQKVLEKATTAVEGLTRQMVAKDHDLPCLLVGGGASLFASGKFVIPSHAHVANAFGAALAEVSSELDRVVSLEDREETLQSLKEEVLQQVVDKGGSPSHARIVDMQIFPYSYIKGNKARVVLTASSPCRPRSGLE